MPEIVLDRKTFEALAIDTRVNILKALRERRKTQAELSRELSLAASTVSEHLDKLAEAGLVTKSKQGRKWIYYGLTQKGESIVSPKKVSVFVFALSISLFMIMIGGMLLYTPAGNLAGEKALQETVMTGGTDYSQGTLITAAPPTESEPLLANETPEEALSVEESALNPYSLAVLAIGIVLGAAAVYWWKK